MTRLGWIPTNRQLVISYVVGFVVCCLTQIIVLFQKGPVLYSNVLFGILLPFHEWFRETWRLTAGSTKSVSERGADIASVIASSAIVALLFPAAVSLLRSKQRPLRWMGFLFFSGLVLMSVVWGRFPNI